MAKEKIKETVKNPEAQGSGTEKRKLKKWFSVWAACAVDNTDCHSQCLSEGFFSLSLKTM